MIKKHLIWRYIRAFLFGIVVVFCLQGSNASAKYDFQKAKFLKLVGIGAGAALIGGYLLYRWFSPQRLSQPRPKIFE